MAKHKLQRHSHAVVHRGRNRTRLRVPRKYRSEQELRKVQRSIEQIPGVQSVSVNSHTGSVLVHHSETPDLLSEIGSALEESAPDLLAAMLLPGGGELEAGLSVLTSFVKKLLAGSTIAYAAAGNGGQAESEGLTAIRAIPLALVAAGAWKLMQEETLLGGLAPLALFYYGFDMYWKLSQEDRTRLLERMSEEQSHSGQALAPHHKSKSGEHA